MESIDTIKLTEDGNKYYFELSDGNLAFGVSFKKDLRATDVAFLIERVTDNFTKSRAAYDLLLEEFENKIKGNN